MKLIATLTSPYARKVRIALADIAAGCVLGYLDFRQPDLDWRALHPNLARLADKLARRPAFAETVPPAA